MFSSIFSNPSAIHLIEIFLWMLGSFLIGLFFGNYIKSKKNNKGKYNIDNFEDLQIKDDISKIRATKTFERGGEKMVKTVPTDTPNNELNFNRIGIGQEENKNNLQLIKGIGSSIEEKLNSIGIYNFEQISNFNNTDIDKITDLIKFFPGRIERDDWVGQSKELLNKNKQ